MDVNIARHRLRQVALFDLVQKAKLDKCFHNCGKPLASKTFSIEHKIPWLGAGRNLFWDLSNIAFSHRRCNVIAARRGRAITWGEDPGLGIPKGTAYGRLRKAIVFELLRRIKQTRCFRCQDNLTLATLSLDHKQNWFPIDSTLFWDLSNIAYSHRRCNSQFRTPQALQAAAVNASLLVFINRKTGATGAEWCGGHQAFLPVTSFHKNRARWNGVVDICIKCRSETRRTISRG